MNHPPPPPLHSTHPRTLLRAYEAPGLFITGTGTDIGKTTVTAALAGALYSLHMRVGICKPVASGCPKFSHRGNDPKVPMTDDDLSSPDAQIAARAAGLDANDESLLRWLSPIRYAAPVAPSQAAVIEERMPDWRKVASALDYWQENADLLLVEGAGGWYVPLNPPPHDFMIADLAGILRMPVLVVTNTALGTLNQTLLTIHAIREKQLPVIGLVINRVPPPEHREIATDANIADLERLSGVPIRAILPEVRPDGVLDPVPGELIEAMVPFAREWSSMVRPQT